MLDRVRVSQTKAYSYLRFSSPEQAKGASRARQIEAAAKWAADNNLILDEELKDEGISAFKGRNRHPTSALGGFLARVEKGEVPRGSYLLVESFDRLSRQEVVDALELFLSLTRNGITIVTLADGCIYNRESLRQNQVQLIISIVIMTRAFEESATKSRRVGDAWARKRVAARERQQAMTATCPGWIRLVGGPREGRYELIEDRAKLVRSIFDDVIAGDGRRTIVRRLNAAKVETWGIGGNKGKQWHDSYVQKILSSPATFGRYERGEDKIDGYFPAVIDEETFWQAKAASASRLVGQGRPTKRFANLLQGLACCHVCGGSMSYVDKGKKGPPRLRCSSAFASAGCTNRDIVRYDQAIESLLAHCYAHFADAALFALRADARKAAENIDALERRRHDASLRRERLIDLAEGGAPIDSVRARLDALTVEILGLDQSIADSKLRAGREAEKADDLEQRIDVILDLVWAKDDAERLLGRAKVNSRLRTFVDKIIVSQGPQLEFRMKREYEDVDLHMASIYSPKKALVGRTKGGSTSPKQRTGHTPPSEGPLSTVSSTLSPASA